MDTHPHVSRKTSLAHTNFKVFHRLYQFNSTSLYHTPNLIASSTPWPTATDTKSHSATHPH